MGGTGDSWDDELRMTKNNHVRWETLFICSCSFSLHFWALRIQMQYLGIFDMHIGFDAQNLTPMVNFPGLESSIQVEVCQSISLNQLFLNLFIGTANSKISRIAFWVSAMLFQSIWVSWGLEKMTSWETRSFCGRKKYCKIFWQFFGLDFQEFLA